MVIGSDSAQTSAVESATPRASWLARAGEVACVALAILAALYVLAPPGSFPVGWDVWWNLHVARAFAESGFPDSLPAAGFTQLARDYADRQLLFHGVLAVFGGQELGPEHVPFFLYGFALAMLAALVFAARMLCDRPVMLAALLAWGLSSTALFRATAMRDMLLALPIFVVFVARLVRCDERLERRDRIWTGVCAYLFTMSHGAPLLLLGFVGLVALARRLDGLRARFAALLVPTLFGIACALVTRPNPLGALELLWTLNVEMPYAAITGALPIQPAEFAALPLASWLRSSWPLAGAALALLGLALRGRVDWRIALPGVALTLGSLFGARLLELAAPLVALGLVVAWPRRLRHPLLVLSLGIGLVCHAVWRAQPSVEANRMVAARDVGRALAERADSGDVVFVTDWGLSSPLAFWTRDKRLVFTGVTDPILMWHEDRSAFEAWWKIKAAQDEGAAATARERFGARFVVVGFADALRGRAPGETSTALWRSMAALQKARVKIVSSDHASPPEHRAIEKGYRLYDMGWPPRVPR